MHIVLRSIIASLVLLAALSLSAAEFQFDATGVTAFVTPSATTYWTCACVGRISGMMVVSNPHTIISDSDGDGIVRWGFSSNIPGGLWTMIDAAAGTITTRVPAWAQSGEPLPFPPKAFLGDEARGYSRFFLDAPRPVGYYGEFYVWWVRPGVGAWHAPITDLGPFDEIPVDAKMLIDVKTLLPTS